MLWLHRQYLVRQIVVFRLKGIKKNFSAQILASALMECKWKKSCDPKRHVHLMLPEATPALKSLTLLPFYLCVFLFQYVPHDTCIAVFCGFLAEGSGVSV